MENYSLFIYVICVVVLVIVCRIFVVPAKRIFKLIVNSILGMAGIYIINYFGGNSGFHIGLNWWTIFSTGFLGIPGVILIVILKLFML